MSGPRDVADAVLRIPREFHARGDVSFLSLLVASGYARERAAVDVSVIEDALRAHPEFVQDWVQHSEDKRTTEGWFFRRAASGGWEVGYWNGHAYCEVSTYRDDLAACAAFIQKEIGAADARMCVRYEESELGIEERSRERRRRMKGHRARNHEDAEMWDLEFWQSQTPAARLAALVAIHRDVENVPRAGEPE